jgi:hypothetical protein
MGAWKVERNADLAGNQIDVYVEMALSHGILHRLAVEAKDWASTVGIKIVNDFATIVKLLKDKSLVHEGVIVSPSGFSKEASEAARCHGIRLLRPADLDSMVAEAEKAGVKRPSAPPIPPPPEPYFAHPYPLQANFTGRVAERRMLTEWLTKGTCPVFVMEAIGGMGKSAVTWLWVLKDVLGRKLDTVGTEAADEAACCVRKNHRPEGVLWWSFYEAKASFATFLGKALIYCSDGQVDPKTIPSPHDQADRLLGLLQQRRILLVLDGFERELRAYAGLNAAYQGDQVTEDQKRLFRTSTDPLAGRFLASVASSAPAGRVLVTSRLFPAELEGQDGKPIAGCAHEKLDRLKPPDAVAFFHAEGIQGTSAEIEEACGKYGYHPLALRLLAGAILHDPKRPGDATAARDYDVSDELVPKEHHILRIAYEAM